MLFGISVLFGNSMDRCTGISVSVVQGFIRCGAVQGFSNGLFRSRKPAKGQIICQRIKVPDALSGHPMYSILQGIQFKLLSGRTRSDRTCSLHSSSNITTLVRWTR